ncbi:MAG: hypothetical protein HQL88_00375 [Magnetococcales bacterium]|nr:hypothetical protein [Magnetococcales bacterium]
MAEIVRLFCAYCNPDCFYQEDRRIANPEQRGSVLPFADHRRNPDRRRRLERRVETMAPPGPVERRGRSRGRRAQDGYAWFEGCIDEALQGQWYVEQVEEGEDSEHPAVVLCPRCRQKIR